MNKPLTLNSANHPSFTLPGPIVLEETCQKCNGNPPEKHFIGIKLGKWCTGCGGRGLVPNENGKAMLDLVAHNLSNNDSNSIIYKVWR